MTDLAIINLIQNITTCIFSYSLIYRSFVRNESNIVPTNYIPYYIFINKTSGVFHSFLNIPKWFRVIEMRIELILTDTEVNRYKKVKVNHDEDNFELSTLQVVISKKLNYKMTSSTYSCSYKAVWLRIYSIRFTKYAFLFWENVF